MKKNYPSSIRVIIFALLLLAHLLPPTSSAQGTAEVPTLSKAQWREDVRYLARELPKRHKNLFHTVTQPEFERTMAELDSAIPSLQDYQIIVRMLQLTAKVGDGHTYVHLPITFKRYPMVLYWFGAELRVVRVAGNYKAALGAQVVKIGNMDLSAVQTRIQSVLSQGENDWFKLSNGPGYMTSPEVLHTLGVVPDIGPATFTFERESGQSFTLNMTPVTTDAAFAASLIGAAKEEPLFRQQPKEPFWFTYLGDSQTVYVHFKSYESLGENARKLFDFIDRNPTQKLVIDMRQNGGGDFTKVRWSLIPGIKLRPALNQKGHLFVVTGRRTFSAAMVNAIDFRKETNAILVGEPAGDKPNSYSENDELRLPNSRLTVSYSTRYYQFLDEDVPAVIPDQRIDPTWPEYLAGRDAVMDWILANDAR